MVWCVEVSCGFGDLASVGLVFLSLGAVLLRRAEIRVVTQVDRQAKRLTLALSSTTKPHARYEAKAERETPCLVKQTGEGEGEGPRPDSTPLAIGEGKDSKQGPVPSLLMGVGTRYLRWTWLTQG